MTYRYTLFTFACTIILVLPANAQLSQLEAEHLKSSSANLVENLYTALNIIGDKNTPSVERKLIINNTLEQLLYNEDVIIEDDLLPARDEERNTKAREYLTNAHLFYYEDGVQFELKNIAVSEVYTGDYLFTIVSFERTLNGKSAYLNMDLTNTYKRTAEIRCDKINGDWELKIVSINFEQAQSNYQKALIIDVQEQPKVNIQEPEVDEQTPKSIIKKEDEAYPTESNPVKIVEDQFTQIINSGSINDFKQSQYLPELNVDELRKLYIASILNNKNDDIGWKFRNLSAFFQQGYINPICRNKYGKLNYNCSNTDEQFIFYPDYKLALYCAKEAYKLRGKCDTYATLYEFGRGLKINYIKAYELYRESGKRGDEYYEVNINRMTQRILQNAGYNIDVDGVIGPQSKKLITQIIPSIGSIGKILSQNQFEKLLNKLNK